MLLLNKGYSLNDIADTYTFATGERTYKGSISKAVNRNKSQINKPESRLHYSKFNPDEKEILKLEGLYESFVKVYDKNYKYTTPKQVRFEKTR